MPTLTTVLHAVAHGFSSEASALRPSDARSLLEAQAELVYDLAALNLSYPQNVFLRALETVVLGYDAGGQVTSPRRVALAMLGDRIRILDGDGRPADAREKGTVWAAIRDGFQRLGETPPAWASRGAVSRFRGYVPVFDAELGKIYQAG